MNEYISREAVLQKFLERGRGYINELTMLYMINEIPAADVQPVKRGKWIWDSSPEFGNPYGSYACSECNERQAFKENYCPNCGARMKEDENDT